MIGLCPRPFNLAGHALRQADARADHPALIVLSDPPDVWRYGHLQQAVLGTATGLTRLGLAPGARLLLRLGNTADFPILFLGAIAADLVPVVTSAQLTGPEITAMAGAVAPAAMIAAPGIALPDPPLPGPSLKEARRWRRLPATDPVAGDPDRPAYVIFTSGTSGRALPVLHAHRALWARRAMVPGWTGLGPGDRLLHAGAFNWTYTLGTGLLDPWTQGATALIPPPGTEPLDLPTLLARHEASIFAAAPGVYRGLLRARMPPLPHLRFGLSAGEKLPETLRDRWTQATGTAIHEAYGQSECSTFISGSRARPAPPGSLGYPQPGRRVAIIGGEGPVPAGTPGTIAIHRTDPGLMLGYDGARAETEARYSGEWFLTGDTGEMAPDGSIRFLGRNDDMLNAGGFRVSPLEVEAALLAHPDIAEAAAIDLRVSPETTVIAACYRSAAPLPDTDLAAHCAARLARYKQPRLFIHRDSLPRSANGKLQRGRLRRSLESRP